MRSTLDEGALRTVFIEKLSGRGLRLRTIEGEHLVFENLVPIGTVAKRVFP